MLSSQDFPSWLELAGTPFKVHYPWSYGPVLEWARRIPAELIVADLTHYSSL